MKQLNNNDQNINKHNSKIRNEKKKMHQVAYVGRTYNNNNK